MNAADVCKVTLLGLLDLIAAFDTFAGFPQTWKTWNSQGISLTWEKSGNFTKSQGTF